MTPSSTFQWPLSSVGTFQPARSWRLNNATKPAGGSLPAPGAAPVNKLVRPRLTTQSTKGRRMFIGFGGRTDPGRPEQLGLCRLHPKRKPEFGSGSVRFAIAGPAKPGAATEREARQPARNFHKSATVAASVSEWSGYNPLAHA